LLCIQENKEIVPRLGRKGAQEGGLRWDINSVGERIHVLSEQIPFFRLNFSIHRSLEGSLRERSQMQKKTSERC